MASTDPPYLVTGAASGIGNATTRQLIAKGHEVISLDIKEPNAQVRAHYHCDMSQPDSIDSAVVKLNGPFASLFNIAGVSDVVGDELAMRINTFGLRHLTEAVWEQIIEGGTVVNVSPVLLVIIGVNAAI